MSIVASLTHFRLFMGTFYFEHNYTLSVYYEKVMIGVDTASKIVISLLTTYIFMWAMQGSLISSTHPGQLWDNGTIDTPTRVLSVL